MQWLPERTEPCAWRARWVVPVTGDPIAQGVVTVVNGCIVQMGTSSDAPMNDLGDVVLMPGLVNAHTHLEFSDLTQPLGQPGQVFPHWIRDVIAWRRGRNIDPVASIELGLVESLRSGVAALGEIATGSAWTAAMAPTCDVTVFYEAICLQPARIAEVLARVDELLDHTAPGAKWRPGLSPHAPYTVHPRLLTALIERAQRRQLPVAMHLAESREELELLAQGTGPFRELLDGMGIGWPHDELSAFRQPFDYLQVLSTAPRSLVIHGNYLTAAETAWLGQQRERMAVVYCPRTHAYFRHEPYPLAALLNAGATVALGTDGRGSNPDLNLLAELRYVTKTFPKISPRQIVELGTLGGARALGIAGRLGSLEVGKLARCVILPCSASDPYETILQG
ncbi:MAG: amidohydrolase family protein [Planctomycetaceae bacterium]|nr:amidohydrolase family protein [Planctomycetaceae bacterium]